MSYDEQTSATPERFSGGGALTGNAKLGPQKKAQTIMNRLADLNERLGTIVVSAEESTDRLLGSVPKDTATSMGQPVEHRCHFDEMLLYCEAINNKLVELQSITNRLDDEV